MIRHAIAVALLGAYLHACAVAVGATEPSSDADTTNASDDAPDAAEASVCRPGTVEYEGACCWIARDGECAAAACEALLPAYAGQTFCANPQLCCARPR